MASRRIEPNLRPVAGDRTSSVLCRVQHAYAWGRVTMPRCRPDALTDGKAIAHAVTSAARRRAGRGSARLLERLQLHHPERTPCNRPARATVDAGWRDRPRGEHEREGAA
jgi:hypothetical protein